MTHLVFAATFREASDYVRRHQLWKASDWRYGKKESLWGRHGEEITFLAGFDEGLTDRDLEMIRIGLAGNTVKFLDAELLPPPFGSVAEADAWVEAHPACEVSDFQLDVRCCVRAGHRTRHVHLFPDGNFLLWTSAPLPQRGPAPPSAAAPNSAGTHDRAGVMDVRTGIKGQRPLMVVVDEAFDIAVIKPDQAKTLNAGDSLTITSTVTLT